MRMQLSFRLPYILTFKDKWILASCPVLDVHSQGGSEAEAIANLREALQLFLEGCFEMGTLEQVLKDSGFHLSDAQAPKGGQPTIEIPLNLARVEEALKEAR
jgi:predicted RNase H-like HicB family nuclease